MEAVSKLPLISFELKTISENTHFGPKLKQYIAEAYREDPESYNDEIYQLEALRSAAVRPTTDFVGLACLYKYFNQLRTLQSRFPMGKGQPAACSFSWKDLYANMTSSSADVKIEMASILYNIGALHTQLGASEPRNSADSMKEACTHYQTAAGAFQQIKEQYPQPQGLDMSTDIMRMFEKICFAQAQECILEKSIQDARKSSVVGAVATQVFMFYKNALAVLGPSTGTDNIHEIIGTKLYNYWYRFLSFKASYIGCIVSLYQGINAEEHQKFGERLAFYLQAAERLAEARKLAKYIEPVQVTQEALTFTNDVVEGKKKAAKNENEFIYHEEVPEKDLLTEMKPVCLVKHMSLDFQGPEVFRDIFTRLVPIGAHEASSLYSEEKAKLLRSVVSQVESKNTELTEFMSSLQLDQLEVIDSEQNLPQDIVDRCAAMNAKTEIIQSLVDSMNNLAEIISDVEQSLLEIKALIQEETMKEKEYQKTMGPRPPSIVQTELSREYHKYHEAHSRTNDSNQVLHKAMTLHIANLKLLAHPLDVLHSKIPSIDCIEGLDRATMTEMRRVVGKAREMQTQRDALVQQLREALTADDVTAVLLARGGDDTDTDTDTIFKQELEKHTPKVKIIEQNLAAQENIINRLTSLYASYGESRRLLTDVLRKREGLINALITSYDTYEELLGKAHKGLEFYRKLAHNVGTLHTRLRGTCQVQDEERQQLLAKITKPSTPTPSVTPKASELSDTSTIPALPAGGGRKLKDYLPYMQNRGRRSVTPQAQMEQMPADMYYPEAMYPTSIRPTPVGSEATDMSMQLPDGGILPMQGQPNPYERYASPYASSESDSYASQHNYAYPTTSKDYEKPETNPYGYSAYTPQQYASHSSDQSQQIYSNPHYSATYNNAMIVSDSQSNMQYQAGMSQTGLGQNMSQPNINQPNMNQGNINQPNMNHGNMNQPNVNQPNMNQGNMNQPNVNLPIMTQGNMNQPNVNQTNMNQGNMNQPNVNQPNINQGNTNRANINQPSNSNQYAIPTNQGSHPNHYANPSSSHANPNPNQFGYDSYSSAQSQATPIPDVVPPGYNTDLSTNFSQMQINAPKSEAAAFGDYTQTYYSVQYPQSNTPNMATYSHAPQNANTSMVSAPSDYGSLNYPYSDATQFGQTSTSAPYSAEQYFAKSGHANVSQGQTTYTQADSSATSTTSVANTASASQAFGYAPEIDPNYANPSFAHLDAFDKPIKSHAKGEALSSYAPTFQQYNTAVPNAASLYSNPSEQTLQNVPSQMIGQSDQRGAQNVPQVYMNPNEANNPNAQAQVYSTQTNPSTHNMQPPQAYSNPNESSYSQRQGYQNHPGYTYDPVSGNYAYAYGSQNAVSYDPGAANVHPQASAKDQNWSAQGVYTSAGMCETVQSPSLETPPQAEPAPNQQIYYNSPYGYVTNTNQANQLGPNQAMPTNYGADMNQSTYMQSSQHGQDTSVTFTNNQVSTPKENVTEPNFDQSHTGYSQTHDSHNHVQSQPLNDQNTSYSLGSSNAGQSIPSADQTNQTVSEPSTPQNTEQANNQVQNPEPEKQEIISESKPEPSVFDLLSDIDFSVEQKPLMPQIKVPQISESAIVRPTIIPKVELLMKPPPKEKVIERPAKKDLFTDPSLMNKFTQEVKNLQKLTDSLTNMTVGSLTVLDAKWKTFQDVQNKENMTRSKTIAMQHTSGNIVTEVVPYDDSRLTLKSDPDAYINASYYKQLVPWCIPLVISKNPTETEYRIFWKAVLENKISCIVCLLGEIEMQGKSYWPTAKGQTLELDGVKVTLEEVSCTVHWTERRLTVAGVKTVLSVTHYQINVFPAKIVCSPLVLLVDKILQQTYEGRPGSQLCGAWLQCGAGAGRSALLALLVLLVCQVRAGQLDLCDMLDLGCVNLIKHRSNVLEDTKYLADAYRTALFYVQGVLCSGTTTFNGEAVSLPSGASVLPPVTPTPTSAPSLLKTKFSRESFEEMKQSPGLKSGDMKDPLNFLDPLWSLKKK